MEGAEERKRKTNEERDREREDNTGKMEHRVRGKKGINTTGTWQDKEGAFNIEDSLERQR